MTDPLGTDAWGTRDYLDAIEELTEMGDFAAADEAIVAALGMEIEWNGKRLHLPEFRWEQLAWNGRGKTRDLLRTVSYEAEMFSRFGSTAADD